MPARDTDPLDAVLRPPFDETLEEKEARLRQEAEARRVSFEIDEEIKRERLLRKKKQVVRLLLLGQSESGKSTTLRQFQRLYTPSAFREERVLWRSVIQLNLVRSIRIILDAVSDARQREFPVSSASEGSDDEASSSRTGLPGSLQNLVMRLLPLRHIEKLLIAKLVPPNEDEATHLGMCKAERDGASCNQSHHHHYHNEVFVRPAASCKAAMFSRARMFGRSQSSEKIWQDTQDEAQAILCELRDDIATLWNDRGVRDLLKRRKIRLEEGPGFFLNDLGRITTIHYCPSDDDVLRARLKTVGVSEYKFEMEAGYESGTEWRIIDVGGSRSQRQTWVPFFDDVDAIIFLAPISGFDQTLVEDRNVNRLEDSVILWKSVCQNQFLANVELVLFLNKCDILEAKLRAGVRLAKYVRSFGNKPNDAESAQLFFKTKFSAIHREHSPKPRKFYGFCTSVTDTTTTSGILVSVRDIVMREHLRKAKLLS